MKLFVTGGHITPALAVIENLVARHPEWEIVVLGRMHAMEGAKVISEEYRLVQAKRLRFLPINTGRLQRALSLHTLSSIIKIPIGLCEAMWYCLTERPDLVVSFGGYVAWPVAMAAWVCSIPVITHEQTTVPGLANRFIAKVAKKICITFPDGGKFDSRKVVMTGLPMRSSIFHKNKYSYPSTRPLLYVLGGSTGSVSINDVIYPLLPTLLQTYQVVHQVGRSSEQVAQGIANKLPLKLREHYHPLAYLGELQHASVLHQAHIVLSRSGANTVVELGLLGKVCLLVPLPWSAGGEQLVNARVLESGGGAIIIDQKDLSGVRLINELKGVEKNYSNYLAAAAAVRSNFIPDASDRMINVIEQLVLHS